MRYVGYPVLFEQYAGGSWVADPAWTSVVQIDARAASSAISAELCAPEMNACASTDLFGVGPVNLLYSYLDFGVPYRDPHYLRTEELQCEVADCTLTARDVFSFDRSATRGDLSMHDEVSRVTGLETIVAMVSWTFVSPNWIPTGGLGLDVLYSLKDQNAGSGIGEFSYEIYYDGVLQEGSYRGTFEVRFARMPAPGTLALLGVGALLFSLRRHRVSER